MSAVSLVSRTAPVPVGRAICHLMSSFASPAARVSQWQCVCECVFAFIFSLCFHLLFSARASVSVWLVCAFIRLSCTCVCLTRPPPPFLTPPAGSVSCACCADNQCVTSAGSVQQEQGTGLISTHTHTHTHAQTHTHTHTLLTLIPL